MGVGEATQNPKLLEKATEELTAIAGQKPLVRKARKSIANFKLRQGQSIGAMVTLRGDRMWEFFDRLVSVALPRVRDFKGVSPKAFDGRGNYTLGIREQIIFPEVELRQGREDHRAQRDRVHQRAERRRGQGAARPSRHAVPGVEQGRSAWPVGSGADRRSQPMMTDPHRRHADPDPQRRAGAASRSWRCPASNAEARGRAGAGRDGLPRRGARRGPRGHAPAGRPHPLRRRRDAAARRSAARDRARAAVSTSATRRSRACATDSASPSSPRRRAFSSDRAAREASRWAAKSSARSGEHVPHRTASRRDPERVSPSSRRTASSSVRGPEGRARAQAAARRSKCEVADGEVAVRAAPTTASRRAPSTASRARWSPTWCAA